MWSPCTHVGHATLKHSIKKGLADYAASRFLIKGMRGLN